MSIEELKSRFKKFAVGVAKLKVGHYDRSRFKVQDSIFKDKDSKLEIRHSSFKKWF